MDIKKSSILIIGNIGATNTGDEAILEGILSRLHSLFPSILPKVLSAHPHETERRYQKFNIEALSFFPAGIKSTLKYLPRMVREFKKLKEISCALMGGGGLFTDGSSKYAVLLWSIQASYVVFILKKPLHIICQSVGPLRSSFGKWCTKFVFSKAASISVRDDASRILLEELLEKPQTPIEVLTDPALFLHEKNIEEKKVWQLLNAHPEFAEEADHMETPHKHHPPMLHIALSLRPWKDTPLISRGCIEALSSIAREHDIHVHLVPMQFIEEEDVHILEGVQRLCKQKHIPCTMHMLHSPNHVKELLSSMNICLGMRLHFLLLGISSGSRVLGIPYSSKVEGIFREFQLEDQLLPSIPTPLEIKTMIEKTLAYSDEQQELHRTRCSTYIKKKEQEFDLFIKNALSSL